MDTVPSDEQPMTPEMKAKFQKLMEKENHKREYMRVYMQKKREQDPEGYSAYQKQYYQQRKAKQQISA